ncbi:MAG: DUF1573 domain-containing protein [Gemmataceae bacterium]
MMFALVTALVLGRAMSGEQRFFPDGTRHDFGQVSFGQTVSHSFTIANTDKVPLHISSVRSSAGSCITASIQKKVLLPGEQSKIAIKLNCRYFRGPKTASVYLTIDSGPETGEAKLIVQANSTE